MASCQQLSDRKEWAAYHPRERTTSILSRQGHIVFPTVLLTYTLLLLLTGYNTACNVDEPFAIWTSYYYFAAGFSFITSIVQQLHKVQACWHENKNGGCYDKIMHYLAAVSVATIAGASSLSTYSLNYGGICRDVLGIDSSAAQWSEWITCVPLMAYIALAVDHKPCLTMIDCAVVIGIILAVSSGVIMNFNFVNYIFGIFLFIFGSCSLLASHIATLYIRVEECNVETRPSTEYHLRRRDDEIIASVKKTALMRLMFFIFPIFPLAYLLKFCGVIDRDQLYVTFVLLSVIAKHLFVSSLVDIQISATDDINSRMAAEAMANESRRIFLRYVFHELRIPLNTITMGMAIIEDRRGGIDTYVDIQISGLMERYKDSSIA